MSKYKNRKVEVDGILFDSKMESLYYLKHKNDKYMKMQEKFVLVDRFECGGKKYRQMTYTPDFVHYDADGNILKVVDVKGFAPNDFKLKAKLFMSIYKVPIILTKYYVRKDYWEEKQA